MRFFGSNPSTNHARLYPSAHLRVSLSSIPYPSHINLTLNGQRVDLSPAFEESWTGSKDRDGWTLICLAALPVARFIYGPSSHPKAGLSLRARAGR